MTRHTLRQFVGISVATTLMIIVSPLASATWSAVASGSGAGAAATMGAGSEPSGSASGSSITISWAASTLSSGTPVAGYAVARYNTVNGSPATVNSGCAGVVTTTTCTETSVPAGSWEYTVTPEVVNWRGAVSPTSAAIVTSS